MLEAEKHSILLVDDEPEILFSLKSLLRREFVLHTAESGAEALQVLERHRIHVIMTDQRMPGMTGVELMNQVKDRWPHAIRIVFTGYADIKAVVDAINNSGLYRYITKPWDPDDLIDTLHEAAQRYEELREQRRLLTELHEFVGTSTRIATQLANGEPTVLNGNTAHEFRLQGEQLLARLIVQLEQNRLDLKQ